MWGKTSEFPLKTQPGGSLRLLSGAPQPLKKKPGLNLASFLPVFKKLKASSKQTQALFQKKSQCLGGNATYNL